MEINLKKILILSGCLLLTSAPVWAGNGHMLHGVGPVNSSMGGAGVALPIESLGALTFNPALITAVTGNQVSFATEFFQDYPKIDLSLSGGLTGHTNPTTQLGVIPAFGWMMRAPNSKFAVGFGLIGIAGFRTDYPEDAASIIFQPPPIGYGRIYTDYSLTKIPLAFAYQATPKLSVGASFILYRGTIAIAPLPDGTFDTDPAGNKWYPLGGNVIAQWTIGGQVGFHYKVNDKVAIGASYTTMQNFKNWTWNSFYADPGSVKYGQGRLLSFTLDGPGNVTFGVAMQPKKKLQVAIDGGYTTYQATAGFGGVGGVHLDDHTFHPFGWRNIWIFKAGLQHQLSEKLTVRAGFNFSQTPIRSEVVVASTGTPATFQKHFCFGLGMKMLPTVTADMGFYFVPREHVKGPNLSLSTGPVPGSTYDMSNALISGLIAFNFRF